MGKNSRKKKFVKGVIESSQTESGENVYETVIKEFSLVTKSTGLVVGTNEVMRRLERKQLAAVFLFSKQASPPIYHTFSQLCRKSEVPFVTLDEKDKSVLGPQFPVSITYGIKIEYAKKVPSIDNLQKKMKMNKPDKRDQILPSEAPLKKPNIPKEFQGENDFNVDTFYHKKHTAKRKIRSCTEEDILSIKEIEFPDYNLLTKDTELIFSAK